MLNKDIERMGAELIESVPARNNDGTIGDGSQEIMFLTYMEAYFRAYKVASKAIDILKDIDLTEYDR
jgi:hypothetical protein